MGDYKKMSMSKLSMGSTVRRLRIFYINNMRLSKTVVVLGGMCLLYLMWKGIPGHSTNSFASRAKYEEESETGYHSEAEIQSYLDSLQDTRPIICRDQAYDFTRLDHQESISIITEFTNEQFYNLQLTLSSVVEHTPYELYQEIVVIDDGSTDVSVRKQAALFLKNSRFAKVKMYRSDTVDGQSATRFKASQLAKGDYLIYVSHTTVVNHGWIQPLIAHVTQDWNRIIVPHSDSLLAGQRFYRTDDSLVPILSWSMYTVFLELASTPTLGTEDLLPAPVMRGDVLAVRKSFLQSIGNFDEHFKGVDVSSGHHAELSLRAWMCGGGVQVAVCSRVATHSALKPQHISDQGNYRRVVELWFDEYKHLAYRQGEVSETLSEDETKLLQMRRSHLQQVMGESNACQDYRWYMKNVLKDVVMPTRRMVHFGKVKAKSNYCLRVSRSTRGHLGLDMSLCRQHIYDKDMMFELNSFGALSSADMCLEGDEGGERAKLELCVEGEEKQKWKFTGQKLINVRHPGKCLAHITERDPGTMELYHVARLVPCVIEQGTETMRLQTWEFVHY